MADQTTPTTGNPSSLVIPDDVAQKYPELVELIKSSESMNGEERQYWINILPIMTPEQVKNLFDILDNERKQLKAIDEKYATQINAVGQPEAARQTEEEIKRRREERSQQERSAKETEDQNTASILEQIQSA